MDFIREDYENKTKEKNKYLNNLHQIIVKSGIPLEGNCFYTLEHLKWHG